MKKSLIFVCIFIVLLIFPSCDDGLEFVGIEITHYPSKIIYVAGKDQTLDLSGGVIQLTIREGDKYSYDMSDSNEFQINHNIDFNTSGVYKVELVRTEKLKCSFAVEVIDLKDFKLIE